MVIDYHDKKKGVWNTVKLFIKKHSDYTQKGKITWKDTAGIGVRLEYVNRGFQNITCLAHSELIYYFVYLKQVAVLDINDIKLFVHQNLVQKIYII